MTPRPKSKPLTPEQTAMIYDTYISRQPKQYISMASLAKQYHTSPSVIHRAIHTEGYRRSTALLPT